MFKYCFVFILRLENKTDQQEILLSHNISKDDAYRKMRFKGMTFFKMSILTFEIVQKEDQSKPRMN